MTNDETISAHYLHGNLLQAIQASITKLGKTVDDITIEELAPADEFHIGGRVATEHLMNQLGFSEKDHLLDVGCGLGGAARFVAHKYNSQVTGIDLSQEYIETGNALCAWVNLDEKVILHHGNASTMPFQDESFDGGYMLHVGMNIEDKELLFREIYRLLRKGSSFGVYDIMRINEGQLAYPVPWAGDERSSWLSTPEQYKQALGNVGFAISNENNRRDFALEFFRKLQENIKANGGPPPMGLHVLMKESTPIKITNMVDNIRANYIAPVEIIAKKI